MKGYGNVKKLEISDLVREPERIYAHLPKKGDGKEPELLEEHIARCETYFKRLLTEKELEPIFQKMEHIFLKDISDTGVELFRKMAFHVIRLHDLGKINPHFQRDRMKNDLGVTTKCALNTHHSMASAVLYMDIFLQDIIKFPRKEQYVLLDFMLLHAYVISRHHGRLTTLEEFKRKLIDRGEGKQLLDKEEQLILLKQGYKRELFLQPGHLDKILEKSDIICGTYDQEKKILRMFYVRLMFSILTACDFYATFEYLQGLEQTEFGSLDIEPFHEHYRKSNIYQNIMDYQTYREEAKEDLSDVKDINILRSELFLEAEQTLSENLDQDIFYLDAPTGSGKSNTALNLSFQLLKQDSTKKKILYVYPFNTLVEQNIEILRNSFGDQSELMDKITVVNSLTPIRTEKKYKQNLPYTKRREIDLRNRDWEEEEEKLPAEYYQSALLDRQFLNYPIVLTTHVSLFRFLFGSEKEDLFAFHQLANSVIVLDEIQSYRNEIWSEMIVFLSCCAKLLNFKIIIMSATLPDLDLLSSVSGKTVQLIRDRKKYAEHPLFQGRVKPDFSLLESQDIQQDLYAHVKEEASKEKRKILLEFIKKSSAMAFYQRLREAQEVEEFPGYTVELMTGDDNPAERNRILEQVKESHIEDQGIILVATQVIEAGVDIDMDIGYKNISLLDSEEQFMGRINRSSKRRGTVYFFCMDQATDVYSNDVRLNSEFTLKETEIRTLLEQKDYSRYYHLILPVLRKSKSYLNDQNLDKFFNETVGELEFSAVSKRMELIENQSNQFTIFLDHTVALKGDDSLAGAKIWEEYRSLLSDRKMDYAVRRIELSKVRAKMSYFTYQIYGNQSFPYEDRIGDLFFVQNGENYFTEGKFDRKKFHDQMGLFISL